MVLEVTRVEECPNWNVPWMGPCREEGKLVRNVPHQKTAQLKLIGIDGGVAYGWRRCVHFVKRRRP